jgi:hypothetical protein
MNRYQKLAWFNLIVITATIVITTAGIAIEIRTRGYSTIAPWFFVAILLLLKLKPFLFWKPESEGGVVSDERDSFIVQRAASFAYTTFWYVFYLLQFCSACFQGWEGFCSCDNITTNGYWRSSIYENYGFSVYFGSVRPGK